MLANKHSINLVLLALLVVSSLVVIKVRHESRATFVSLQDKQKQKQQLQSEEGRLFIERATWARDEKLIDSAERQLDMSVPRSKQIITIKNIGGENV